MSPIELYNLFVLNIHALKSIQFVKQINIANESAYVLINRDTTLLISMS